MHFQPKSNGTAPEAYVRAASGTGFVLASLCQLGAVRRDRLQIMGKSKADHFSAISC